MFLFSGYEFHINVKIESKIAKYYIYVNNNRKNRVNMSSSCTESINPPHSRSDPFHIAVFNMTKDYPSQNFTNPKVRVANTTRPRHGPFEFREKRLLLYAKNSRARVFPRSAWADIFIQIRHFSPRFSRTYTPMDKLKYEVWKLWRRRHARGVRWWKRQTRTRSRGRAIFARFALLH